MIAPLYEDRVELEVMPWLPRLLLHRDRAPLGDYPGPAALHSLTPSTHSRMQDLGKSITLSGW